MTTVSGAVLGSLRRGVGETLRARVAGDDAVRLADAIWGADGPRWFGPQDPIWRVHDNASMFAGGMTSLLLQSLHPLAMAGVAGHSGYRSDPWGRLQRTSHFIASTTFGTIDHAEGEIEKIRRVHDRVRGKDDRGRPYSANDPQLLLWVHAAEAHSFLTAYQAYSGTPLTSPEADEYVRQTGIVATRLGVTDPPDSVAGLESVLAGFRPELHTTPAARDAARYLLLTPPVPAPLVPGYALIAAGGVALLPEWACRELGIPVGTPTRALGRLLGTMATNTVRWAMTGLQDRTEAA